MHRFIFPFSLFLSSCLLFIIQPMVAKILLPVYGGTPAVWSVCMLFFQGLLLVAYGYAWVLSRFAGTRSWRLLHVGICVLSLCFLPLAFSPQAASGVPEVSILGGLLLQLGLPLLVVGSSAPLLQYAYSQTGSKKSADPYFLYAASNAGSLLALLSYPWLVERFSTISQQFAGWNIVYLLYLASMLWILVAVRYQPLVINQEKVAALGWKRTFSWIFLSFIPCSLMLGVTFYITTDVAATPLFWVLPLALYLLSFVLMFAPKPLISLAWVERNILFFLIFPILAFIMGANQIQAWQLIAAHLSAFFMLALLCHGRLVQSRPPVMQLTAFYFCLALGGVLAGVFNGFLAPRLFAHAYEYPLVILLAMFCIPLAKNTKGYLLPVLALLLLTVNYFLPSTGWLAFAKNNHMAEIIIFTGILLWAKNTQVLLLSMAILFMFIFMPWFKPVNVLAQQRNFYGVKQVFAQAGAHVLISQSTIHGFQMVGEKTQQNGAGAYYGSILPVVKRMQSLYQPLHALVIGLGTGIMACQFRAQDVCSIVEIDQQVIDIARDPRLFTFLRDCPAKASLIQDDGRLAVMRTQDAANELLVVDAFNSDAIPVHLLTLEAFALYKQKISANGVILVNISNRHLHILPVLIAAGRQLDMIVLHKKESANPRLGQLASEWALLTSNEPLAGSLLGKNGWRFVTDVQRIVWTDDYSNLLPLLKWQ